jgi:hypothetical protein
VEVIDNMSLEVAARGNDLGTSPAFVFAIFVDFLGWTEELFDLQDIMNSIGWKTTCANVLTQMFPKHNFVGTLLLTELADLLSPGHCV